MKQLDDGVPEKYKQPIRPFLSRHLNNTLEEVDYVPQAHLRIWYNNQNEGYSMHHHDAMEMIICIENSYSVIADHQMYHLNVGDILLIPPHMLHELIYEGEGVRFICLFNVEILQTFQDFKVMTPIFLDAYLCNAQNHPDIYQKVYSMSLRMVDAYFTNKIFWESTIYSILIEIFATIGKEYFRNSAGDSLNESSKEPREHYDKIAALLSYIDSHYAEDITLEQAAAYIGFSKYHFSHLFKQHTNTTFCNYLCHKRIQSAQAMLSSDIPVTNIAFQVGFNNLTTFCRCFKKYTNCSPTEYREITTQDHHL